MKKAFFSFAIIAVVSAALILFAAYSKSWYDYRMASNYGLEARLVDQRANDSAFFLSGMLDDLLVDSAFNAMGCSASNLSNGTDVCMAAEARIGDYLQAAANLSYEPAIVTFWNTTEYDFQCGNSTLETIGQPTPHNYTYIYANLTANYTVNSTNARKHVDILINKPFFFINRSGDHPNYFNATVTTAYARNQSFYVDCK